MSFPIKGIPIEGAGSGLIRLSGSFDVTTGSPPVPTLLRPKLGNFQVVRRAAGVYAVIYNQSTLSVVSSNAELGPKADLIGSGLPSSITAWAVASKDFMDYNAGTTHFVADPTNRTVLILIGTGSALEDLPAHMRCSFTFVLGSSSLNF